MAKKKKDANAFDAFASTSGPAKSASKKIAVEGITPELKEQVDLIIGNKAKIKALKATQNQAELALMEHVFPQQEAHARAGNFCKSFTIVGTGDNSLTITWPDKWSVPKEPEVHTGIKGLLGKLFDNLFKMVRKVTLTDKAMNDGDLINDFVAVAKERGYEVPEAFTITDALICAKDMDQKQFDLPKAKLATLRTMIKQTKATIK